MQVIDVFVLFVVVECGLVVVGFVFEYVGYFDEMSVVCFDVVFDFEFEEIQIVGLYIVV